MVRHKDSKVALNSLSQLPARYSSPSRASIHPRCPCEGRGDHGRRNRRPLGSSAPASSRTGLWAGAWWKHPPSPAQAWRVPLVPLSAAALSPAAVTTSARRFPVSLRLSSAREMFSHKLKMLRKAPVSEEIQGRQQSPSCWIPRGTDDAKSNCRAPTSNWAVTFREVCFQTTKLFLLCLKECFLALPIFSSGHFPPF